MKKALLALSIILLTTATNFAQKYAYVDTEYILSNIPTYEAAQDQLEELSKKYQQEVEAAFQEVKKLDDAYQKEEVLLSPEMKKKRQDVILEKEQAARKLQKKYFGREGELYKRRQELIKPIQDEVFSAIKEIAEEGNYAILFDAAGSLSMLYTDPEYDLSDDVLKKMGYNN